MESLLREILENETQLVPWCICRKIVSFARDVFRGELGCSLLPVAILAVTRWV